MFAARSRGPSTTSRCSDPVDRLVLGVSGGKDSLALWDILTHLGYSVDGVYLHLGIGDTAPTASGSPQEFAETRGLSLQIVDLPDQYDFSVPEAAAASHRSPCSACGLSKRYILNRSLKTPATTSW